MSKVTYRNSVVESYLKTVP